MLSRDWTDSEKFHYHAYRVGDLGRSFFILTAKSACEKPHVSVALRGVVLPRLDHDLNYKSVFRTLYLSYSIGRTVTGI